MTAECGMDQIEMHETASMAVNRRSTTQSPSQQQHRQDIESTSNNNSDINKNNTTDIHTNNDNNNNNMKGKKSPPGSPTSKLSPLEVELLPLNDDGIDKHRHRKDIDDDVFHDEEAETIIPISIDYSNLSYKERFIEWLYPSNIPRSCQLLRRENIAIPMCYLLVGILQGLSGPFINVYPLDLGATEAQQITLSSIRSLPASLKLLFGFLSDTAPILGYRRKSYMFIGWTIASLAMLSMLHFSNLTLIKYYKDVDDEEEEDNNNNQNNEENNNNNNDDENNNNQKLVVIAPDDAPSVSFLAIMMLLFGLGFWMADVMGDSLVAEKAKLEPQHSRGSIQSSCYSYRFFGLMCAAPISTVLYSTYGPQVVVRLLGILPLLIVPLIYMLSEIRYSIPPTPKEQCYEIWNTVCSRAVWQPLGFVFLYNLLQVQNGAWREYLKTTLEFTAAQLNMIYIASCVLLYLGILTYKYYFIHYSWRTVYIATTLLNGIFSILQILLILGITFGLSNFLFALGDDAFAEFIQGIQFLPATIMMVNLCPVGSEGASYAMFTTMANSAGNLSVALSSLLLPIWDVSKDALSTFNLSGMINLTILTTCIQTSGVLFVKWLPEYKEDLNELKSNTKKSKLGGFIFLFVTISSIIYAIVIGVLNIVKPGWMGES